MIKCSYMNNENIWAEAALVHILYKQYLPYLQEVRSGEREREREKEKEKRKKNKERKREEKKRVSM